MLYVPDQQNSILIGSFTSTNAPSALEDNTVMLGNTDTIKWLPADDNGVDLGLIIYSFKDGYFDGTINGNITSTGTSTFTTVDINGGNMMEQPRCQ